MNSGRATGRTAGTVRVKDIRPGNGSSASVATSPTWTARCTFAANDGSSGYGALEERRDGGRHRARQGHMQPGAARSCSTDFANVGGTLYFPCQRRQHRRRTLEERRDGRPEPSASKISAQGSCGSYPSALTNVDGTLYFKCGYGDNSAPLEERRNRGRNRARQGYSDWSNSSDGIRS